MRFISVLLLVLFLAGAWAVPASAQIAPTIQFGPHVNAANIEPQIIIATEQAVQDYAMYLDAALWYSITATGDNVDGYIIVYVAGFSSPDWEFVGDGIAYLTVLLWADGGCGMPCQMHASEYANSPYYQPEAAPAVMADGMAMADTQADDTWGPPGFNGVPSLYFPWQRGSVMLYGELGYHEAGFGFDQYGALDFVCNPAWTDCAPNMYYAAADGWLSFVCDDGTSVAVFLQLVQDDIKKGSLVYAHFDPDELLISRGHGGFVARGQAMGPAVVGAFDPPSPNCGYAEQAANSYHLHFGFPGQAWGYVGFEGLIYRTDLAHQGFFYEEIGDAAIYEPEDFILARWNDGQSETGASDNLWDIITETVWGIATFGSSRFEKAEGYELGTSLAETAVITASMLTMILTSNLNFTIPALVIGIIMAIEFMSPLLDILRGVAKIARSLVGLP